MSRGQVTLFVIIGLSLLLVAGLVLLAVNLSRENVPSQQPEVTHDFAPVINSFESLVKDCLVTNGRDVVREVFSHGGFLPNESLVFIPERPTSGSAVSLDPDGSFLVPFWLDFKGSASCASGCYYSLRMPPLSNDGSFGVGRSVEDRVSEALLPRVRSCLSSFQPPNDYEVFLPDNLSLSVFFGDGKISYSLFANVSFLFVPLNTSSSVSLWSAEDVSNAKRLYLFAQDLFSGLMFNNRSRPFANVANNIINAYSLDYEIPPMYGETTFAEINPRTWSLPDVESKLRVLLADNIPLITVPGSASDTVFVSDNPYSDSIYNGPVFKPLPLLDDPDYLSSVKIDFFYLPFWPLDLKITPGGYLIKPTTLGLANVPLLPFNLGFTTYNFQYDLLFPVVFSLQDPDGFGPGEPLNLLFAVETGLRANDPVDTGDLEVLSSPDSVPDLFSSSRINNSVVVRVVDFVSEKPVPGVPVYFFCGPDQLSLGVTNDDGLVNASTPLCIGGFVSGVSHSYHFSASPLDVVDDSPHELLIYAYPFKPFKINFRTRPLVKGVEGFVLSSSAGFTHPDDEVVYLFTRRGFPGEDEQVVAGSLNGSVSSVVVNLTFGYYDVEVFLIRHFGEGYSLKSLVIPEERKEVDSDPLNPLAGKDVVVINETVFNDSLLVGSLELTFENGDPLVINESVFFNDSITLFVPELDPEDLLIPRYVDSSYKGYHENLEVLGSFDQLVADNPDLFKPVFSTD